MTPPAQQREKKLGHGIVEDIFEEKECPNHKIKMFPVECVADGFEGQGVWRCILCDMNS